MLSRKSGGRHDACPSRVLAVDRGRRRRPVTLSRLAWAQEARNGPGRDGAARNMAKHRMARSRSRRLQEARDRHDLAGHCGRRSAGGRGLIRGDWEFAHTGTLPVAEEVLKGHDIVILATPTSEFANSFVMTRKEITQLAATGWQKGRRIDRDRPDQRGGADHRREGGRHSDLRAARSNSIASMPRWQPERSMPARCRSICALPASFATAGTRFQSTSSVRRRYSRRRAS